MRATDHAAGRAGRCRRGVDYADLAPDELEAVLRAERDKAHLYGAQAIAAEIDLARLLAGNPQGARLLSDLEAAVVGRDRAERRVSRLVRELESREVSA